MASVSLARRHRTVERGGSTRSERAKRAEGSSSRKTESTKASAKTPDVTKHKGFRVEYCHINDEFVAIIKDTDMMESAKSMDKAIEKLSRIVKRKLKAAS
jgi:hypothetical protein